MAIEGFLKQAGVLSPSDYESKAEGIEAKRRAAVAPYVAQVKEGAQQRKGIADQMRDIKAPEAPALETLPKEPPMQYRDPTQAWGSLTSVLALLGSLKTRAPLTSALNAGAGAMKAFHARDKQALDLEHRNWKDEMDRALAQNRTELQQYNAAMTHANFDINKAQSQMAAIAAANHDDMMLAGIESGNWDRVMGILQNREKLGTNLAKFMETANYHNQAIGVANERAKLEGSALMLKAQAAAQSAAGLPPDATSIAAWRYLTSGKMPSLGFGAKQARAQILTKASDIAKKMGLSESEAGALPYSTAANQKALNFMTQWAAGVQKSNSAVDYNMQLMMQYADKLGLTNLQPLNKLIIEGKKLAGDPATQAYLTAANTVMTEYARAMSGPTSNAMTTEGASERARELLSSAQSVPQLKAVMKVMQQDMQNQMRAAMETANGLMMNIQNLRTTAMSGTTPAFATEQEAEQAADAGRIHSGEIVIINGRKARVP